MTKPQKRETPAHFPRNSDCTACIWCLMACDLDFSRMKVHRRYADGNVSVVCDAKE